MKSQSTDTVQLAAKSLPNCVCTQHRLRSNAITLIFASNYVYMHLYALTRGCKQRAIKRI